jgi:RNA polymerase primary sigma factor
MYEDDEELMEESAEQIPLTWIEQDEEGEEDELVEEYRRGNNEFLRDSIDFNRAYIDEIARTQLLTSEEEISLTRQMLNARKAAKKIAANEIDMKERAKIRSILDDGLAARERLVMANTRLVISVAKRYVNRGIPFLDLVQEGIVGLIRATGKFDPDRGNRFSTYATWWIRQAITRAIDNHSRTIRLPVHVTSQLSKIGRASAALEQELGRQPTNEEIAESLDTDLETVRSTRELLMQPISLEAPQDEDENRLLGDMIPDDQSETPEETVSESLLRENVDEALAELPWREARVLRLRYGLHGNPVHTLQQVGTVMGITRERVRQIEASALRRLRAHDLRSKLAS